jgi:DNA-binding beta-propeller fold protein YncE
VGRPGAIDVSALLQKTAASLAAAMLAGVIACESSARTVVAPPDAAATPGIPSGTAQAHLPLVLVSEVPLPGGSTRFDYQDLDPGSGHLVVTHMNDGSVLVTDLKDGAVLKELKGIPVARGVVAAGDVGIVFVTSSPDQLVLIDDKSLAEIKRVKTGRGPDGVAWDATHKMVGVSDQQDGALSIIGDSGSGARKQVKLGTETGNVVYDAARGWFWITVVGSSPPNQLVGVDATTTKVAATIPLPGCDGAHGLRIHPDGQSAFIACEGNEVLARVDLGGAHAVSTAKTGSGPDVLAVDPGLGWLYVAAESGDVTVFDLRQPGVVLIGHDYPGDHAHSVAVDPVTHRVFFPLVAGPKGTPVLRIMRPSGT